MGWHENMTEHEMDMCMARYRYPFARLGWLEVFGKAELEGVLLEFPRKLPWQAHGRALHGALDSVFSLT